MISEKPKEFICWSSKSSNSGEEYYMWVQYTDNETQLKEIQNFFKSKGYNYPTINSEVKISQHQAETINQYANVSDDIRFDIITGILTIPDDQTLEEYDANSQNGLFYDNITDLFIA